MQAAYDDADLPSVDETIPVFARWIGSWQISLRRRALSPPQLAGAYDRAAPGWGQTLDRLGVPDAYEALLRRVLGDGASDTGSAPVRVLDCGVGTGAFSRAFARVYRAPIRLDAIDVSPTMLQRADAQFRAADLGVTLRQGDVRSLPYDTAVFDVVIAAHVLEHLSDPEAALDEMARVLKPGGLLITCLTRRTPMGVYVQLKWRTHRVSVEQAERWLRRSGLEDVRCHGFDRNTVVRQFSLACVGRKPDNGAPRES